MNISIRQACLIWQDLFLASEGRASHGYEAEIYAYRLMPYRPSSVTLGGYTPKDDDIRRAAMALLDIVDMFCEEHECSARIDQLPPKQWAATRFYTFNHRVKVEIIKNA